MTLEQLQSFDFAALWANLPPDRQAAIGALAIQAEFATQVEIDGGFDTTDEDRLTAEDIKSKATEALPPIVWAAFPDLLPDTPDDAYPLWQIIDTREPPAEVYVRGVGLRSLIQNGHQWFVLVLGEPVELGGAVDLNGKDGAAPHRWQFWTVADIAAERLRRHPLHQEHHHDRAA